jgi:hypothetical protein
MQARELHHLILWIILAQRPNVWMLNQDRILLMILAAKA